MGNISDEIRLLDAEIEKDSKEINELESYIQNRFKTINDILLISGNEGSMDIELEELEKKSKVLKCLKAYRDILLQSRADKLTEIVFSTTANTPQFEPEKQNKALSVPQGQPESEDSNVKNETVFFDAETNFLWLSENCKIPVEPEDAKVLTAMIDMFNNGRSFCRIEEVILSAYSKTIPTDSKIANDPIYNKYRSAVGAINGKYRELFKTKDKKCKLIQADGKRIVKLSKNVVFRKVLRK